MKVIILKTITLSIFLIGLTSMSYAQTFYLDIDGDGYGDPINSTDSSVLPPNYSADNTDCNDNDAGVNPGAYDICGDGIDQDCTNGDTACSGVMDCIKIDDVPPGSQAPPTPPLIMFVIDASDSMAWKYMYNESETNFRYDAYHGFNTIRYNPAVEYEAWQYKSDATISATDEVIMHSLSPGANIKSITLSDQNKIGGIWVKVARWFMWSNQQSCPYLVHLDGGNIEYFKVDFELNSNGNGEHKINTITPDTSPPSDVISAGGYAYHRQNYANWYRYYSRRLNAAKAVMGKIIYNIDEAWVGYTDLKVRDGHKSVVKSVGIPGLTDYREELIMGIYDMVTVGGTPLRKALEKVGQYFDADDGEDGGIGPSPFSSANATACQRAYAILVTDGKPQGDSTSLGNVDGNQGVPYADTQSNTIADVAMYYYNKDLSSTLDNVVPSTATDSANHQHMVTYTVGFGIQGDFPYDPYTNKCPQVLSDCPANWANGNEIDDLWHAAVNGRGKYLPTWSANELVKNITKALDAINAQELTSAPVTFNSQPISGKTYIFQTSYFSGDWTGDLRAYEYDSVNKSINQSHTWSAQSKLDSQTWGSRNILSYDGSNSKPFDLSDLSGSQKTQFRNNADIVDYIRGDTSKEQRNGGTFRNRIHVLGDIIHSAAPQHNGVVYVGANDGMMHAFRAEDSASGTGVAGDELFAYVPSLVFEHLATYSDTDYSHKYFVDATPVIATTYTTSGIKTWLVGGLGKGGKGYYGIDITDPDSITTTVRPAIWEFPKSGTSTADIDDMGYSFSEVSVVTSNYELNGSNVTVAIFGNGYKSTNQKAVLFVVDMNGTCIRRIPTNVGNTTTECNGLSSPVVIDADHDGTVDFAYAGDLQGNLWKFDLSDPLPTNWSVSYNGQPLFQATNSQGIPKPITSKPDIMKAHDGNGYLITFGTGRYYSNDDIADTSTQSMYGIWDWADAWTKNTVESSSDKSFGAYKVLPGINPPSARLSNINSLSYFTDNLKMLMSPLTQSVQTAINDATVWIETSSNTIDWFDVSTYDEKVLASQEGTYSGGVHVGWTMDLSAPGERIISAPQIINGHVYYVSIIPGAASGGCSSTGGKSVLYILNAYSGASPIKYFDTNDDKKIDENDTRKSGKVLDGINYTPSILNTAEKGLNSLVFSVDKSLLVQGEIAGIYFWRYFR